MRFFEDGPIIPDQLLERRDQGRVVFLCGAGVSINAGLPSFTDLTKYVVDYFDPPKNSPIEVAFRTHLENDETKVPLDQIFHLLQQEYGRDEVNALVSDCLHVEGKKCNQHNIIKRISSDQDGSPQVVTTNFDLLFEQDLVEPKKNIFEPPVFQDINLNIPLTGITYLHGRLQDASSKKHPYILSSADFGRAYLSEAWATKFIRSLLKSYTVVLVGYQAEDPPVKYLLQGLNHDGMSDRSNLYVFEEGKYEDIEAKWRDRGVTAIACKDYACLWKSLEAWADRAVNPRQWRLNVIKMAMNGPRKLSAYQRGQVAHIVRSTPGARLFSQADPSPPPEWLCVFDALCRVDKKFSGYGENTEVFNPHEQFGLDDDPPQIFISDTQSNLIHDHILEWRRGDANPPSFHRLSSRQAYGSEDMPPRLSHLSNWITNHTNSPITAWWATRQRGLHPRLINGIRRKLRNTENVNPEGIQFWNLILEYQMDSRNFFWDSGWFNLKDRVSIEGWTPSVLREFEAVSAPILIMERPFGIGAIKPPELSWSEVRLHDIARWKVDFPDRHGISIEIPDEALVAVFRIADGNLLRAVSLLTDLNTDYFTSPTCYPRREVEGENQDRHIFFNWFTHLFSRLASINPESARGFALNWPIEGDFYLKGLKLFALNHADLFQANKTAESILSLSQSSFWDIEIRRELLFLISDRWEEFSAAKREALAERLLAGPDKGDHWSDEEYQVIKAEIACRYTRWLTLQGKSISSDKYARLNKMISELPEWEDSWASSFLKDHYGSAHRIGMDEAPDTIIELPVSKIIERAEAEHIRDFGSHTEKRPFTGLVKANPRKALASLSLSAKHDQYPLAFWTTLINDWPEQGVSYRLYGVFLNRLSRIPHESIRELRHPVGRWLQDKILSAFKFDPVLAWNTFDHLVSGLISADGSATASAIGEMHRGGELIERSRRTIEYAINSPIGHAMIGLHNILDSLKLDKDAKIPQEFKCRIEQLIASPGEGRDHAISITTRQIKWLFYLDSEWVKDKVIPWFDYNHTYSEPAWNGYLSSHETPPQEIGILLKPQFLELFPAIYEWKWDSHLTSVASQIVTLLTVLRGDHPDGLSNKEARACIRNMNDQNRRDVINRLSEIGKLKEDGWSRHVIPFIELTWPRERKFRTSNLVFSWISLLIESEDDFPYVLQTVRLYLVPLESENYWLFQFIREVGQKQPLTLKYPADVLELLDATISNSLEYIPYDLEQVLDLIEEISPNLASDRRFMRLIGLVEQT